MRNIDSDGRTTMGALDVQECLVLLRWENIGRLALGSHGAAPLVVPVNFVLYEGDIIFRTDDGTKLDRLREQPVSLEVDRFDQYRRIGWSVLVRGIAHEIDAAEVPDLEIETWAPGAKSHWIRIVPTAISGRRLELTNLLGDRRGYL
jgi:nitroimidazol reductase NimA-like FMN-containing flavoprotein (pyridoxamine 5'-phosphate oxidase superfamily)